MLRMGRRQTWLARGLGVAALSLACPVLAKPDGKAAPPVAANPAPKNAAAPEAGAAPSSADPPASAVAAEGASAADSGSIAAVSAEPAPAAPNAQSEPKHDRLAALREETSQLIDEMSQARAKAALLGKTLFKTQVRLRVQNLAAPDPRLIKIELKLDGAPVFVGDGTSLSGDDARRVFEGFIAPGRHILTAELKQQSREDAAFGYTLHDSYHFKVQRDKLSELTLIVDDDSDMASEYPDDGDGEYDVRLKLRVRTKNLGEE